MKNVTSSHVLPFRALIDACWKEKYTSSRFVSDLIAGITVGIIAIPLAMALATMNEQIAQTAEMLATQTASLADITAWLTENFDYQPQPREPQPEYLTPLFAALTQVPPQTGSGAEEENA